MADILKCSIASGFNNNKERDKVGECLDLSVWIAQIELNSSNRMEKRVIMDHFLLVVQLNFWVEEWVRIYQKQWK